MPSLLYVFISRLVSGRGSGIGLYRFLIIAFSFTSQQYQSNIWSSDTKTCMRLVITDRKLFTVCTEQVRSPYTEHAACGLPNPTPLEGEVRLIQAQDQQMLPHIVREW